MPEKYSLRRKTRRSVSLIYYLSACLGGPTPYFPPLLPLTSNVWDVRPRTSAPRYRCIDAPTLTALLGFANTDGLRAGLREWVDAALAKGELTRHPPWTQSFAIGQRAYLNIIAAALKASHLGRDIRNEDNCLTLREEADSYDA